MYIPLTFDSVKFSKSIIDAQNSTLECQQLSKEAGMTKPREMSAGLWG